MSQESYEQHQPEVHRTPRWTVGKLIFVEILIVAITVLGICTWASMLPDKTQAYMISNCQKKVADWGDHDVLYFCPGVK